MKKRQHILITNDDGVTADGIKSLWNSIKEFADITVVAPSNERSASGLSITIRELLKIEQISWSFAPSQEVWAVHGTPSDCVKLALSVILKSKPDLILSGINCGTNAGRNVLYSGTVAAVIEGVLHDIPGIAFSAADFVNPRFDLVENYIPHFVRYVMEHPLPSGTFLNVNFPEAALKIKGIRLTRQGKEFWKEDPEERSHPSGHTHYWLGAKIAQFLEEEESDIRWLKEGYATAVPIHIGELTDKNHIERHKDIFESYVNF